MEKVISFSENLDMFKHLVLLYKDEKGNTYLGSSSHNEKGSENRKNHIILYKEPLPQDKDYIMGWNYLDDHSDKIYLVYNEHSEVAVDDFLAAHGLEKTWRDFDYHVVDSLNDVNDILVDNPLSANEVRAYGTLN